MEVCSSSGLPDCAVFKDRRLEQFLTGDGRLFHMFTDREKNEELK